MEIILDWGSEHAIPLFVALLFAGAVGGYLHWRQRAPWHAEAPLPLLRHHHAFFVALVTAAVFGSLAFAVGAEGWLVEFDNGVTSTVHAWLGEESLRVLAAITWLGNSATLIFASVGVFIVLLLLRRPLLAFGWALSTVGNGLLIRIGKEHFQRVRPVHDHGQVIETGYSFPSGHAAGSVMFYGMLAYVLAVLVPSRWHALIFGTAIAMMAMIGGSRVLLQVHFVSDVFAGYALGIGWGALCVAAIEFLRTSRLPQEIEDAINHSKAGP